MVSDTREIETLMSEGLIPVRKAAVLLPAARGKGGRNPQTVVSYIRDGRNGVKLEGFAGLDQTWWTSEPALARFLARLHLAECGQDSLDPGEAERKRRAEAARQEMARLKRKAASC